MKSVKQCLIWLFPYLSSSIAMEVVSQPLCTILFATRKRSLLIPKQIPNPSKHFPFLSFRSTTLSSSSRVSPPSRNFIFFSPFFHCSFSSPPIYFLSLFNLFFTFYNIPTSELIYILLFVDFVAVLFAAPENQLSVGEGENTDASEWALQGTLPASSFKYISFFFFF